MLSSVPSVVAAVADDAVLADGPELVAPTTQNNGIYHGPTGKTSLIHGILLQIARNIIQTSGGSYCGSASRRCRPITTIGLKLHTSHP